MGSGESYKQWIMIQQPKTVSCKEEKKRKEKKNYFTCVFYVFGMSWQTQKQPDEPNLTGRAYAGCCGHGGQRHQKIFLPAPPSLILLLSKEPKLHGEHADHS